MQFLNVFLQGICNYHAGILNIRKLVFRWETCSICNIVSDQARNHVQQLGLGNRCSNQREYLIHNIENSGNSSLLRLIHHKADHSSLALGTSHIHTGCVTDSAVGDNLYSIQMILSKSSLLINRLWIRQFHRSVALSSLFRGFNTVVIHENHFCIRKRKIKSA